MHYLRAIRSTLYDPAFYMQVKKRGIEAPIKLYAIVVSVGMTIIAIALYASVVPLAFSNTLDNLQAAYPDVLVVTLAGGELSINQQTPYYVKNTVIPRGPENLVVFDIDDTLKGSAKDNAAFFFVKKTYVVAGDDGEERVRSFPDHVGTTTIAKSDVTEMVEKVRPYFKSAVLIGGLFLAVLLTLMGTLAIVIVHVVYTTVPALLVYLLSLIRKERLTYKESYVVAMYATIPVVIAVFLVSRVVPLPPFTYTFLVLLVAIINLSPRSGEHKSV